jgi:hypothetical protein
VVSDVNVLLEIHKRLKRLRQDVADGDKAFRVKAGDMRRTIVRTIGQLMEDGGNKQQVSLNQSMRALFRATNSPKR